MSAVQSHLSSSSTAKTSTWVIGPTPTLCAALLCVSMCVREPIVLCVWQEEKAHCTSFWLIFLNSSRVTESETDSQRSPCSCLTQETIKNRTKVEFTQVIEKVNAPGSLIWTHVFMSSFQYTSKVIFNCVEQPVFDVIVLINVDNHSASLQHKQEMKDNTHPWISHASTALIAFM